MVFHIIQAVEVPQLDFYVVGDKTRLDIDKIRFN